MTEKTINCLIQKEEKEGEEEKKPEEEEMGQPAKAERVVQRRGRFGTRTETRTHTRHGCQMAMARFLDREC